MRTLPYQFARVGGVTEMLYIEDRGTDQAWVENDVDRLLKLSESERWAVIWNVHDASEVRQHYCRLECAECASGRTVRSVVCPVIHSR